MDVRWVGFHPLYSVPPNIRKGWKMLNSDKHPSLLLLSVNYRKYSFIAMDTGTQANIKKNFVKKNIIYLIKHLFFQKYGKKWNKAKKMKLIKMITI